MNWFYFVLPEKKYYIPYTNIKPDAKVDEMSDFPFTVFNDNSKEFYNKFGYIMKLKGQIAFIKSKKWDVLFEIASDEKLDDPIPYIKYVEFIFPNQEKVLSEKMQTFYNELFITNKSLFKDLAITESIKNWDDFFKSITDKNFLNLLEFNRDLFDAIIFLSQVWKFWKSKQIYLYSFIKKWHLLFPIKYNDFDDYVISWEWIQIPTMFKMFREKRKILLFRKKIKDGYISEDRYISMNDLKEDYKNFLNYSF